MFSMFAYLMILHWFGDFGLALLWRQFISTVPDAENKTKTWGALILHVFVYTFTIMFGLIALNKFKAEIVLSFMFIVFFSHLFIDALSSRCSKIALENKNFHMYFAVMGADQLAHYLTLFLTAEINGV